MRWLITIALLLLGGCADLGYYWHSARGHLAVMKQRTDIAEMLADETTDEALRKRLLLVQEIRAFSVTQLGLPENDSYRNYVELKRPWLIKNLFAAPEFSTELHQWCYPVVGCASYRGYYDEQRLLTYVDELEGEGFEVHIGKVSAYSTLGWFDDPVLSSFIDWPDHRLAGLLFHELTHQQLYIDGDTTFNESLASAVQQAGTELWLRSRGQHEQLRRMKRWTVYRAEVVELIELTRDRLQALYASDASDEDKRRGKQEIFTGARATHADIAAHHGVDGGYTHWFAGELNNAKIGSVTAYNRHKPAFMHMIRAHENDFAGFYRYAAALAALDKQQREDCLEAWRRQDPAGSRCPALGNRSLTAS